MNVIYIDVLIVLNIYVNYFLIKATSRMAHSSLNTSSVVISSVIGSLFSLVILLPRINFPLMFIIKAAAAVIIVLTGFRNKTLHEYVRLIIYFYIINFIFAGIIMALRYFLRPEYICINNSYVYIDVSLFSLIIFTAVSYFAVCGIRMILDRGTSADGVYSVIIRNGETMISVEGLADTGNAVTDVFSGKPVIVCSSGVIKDLTGESTDGEDVYEFLMKNKSMRGVRLIPYSTIDGSGALPAFHPDEVIIRGENTVKNVDVMIGIKETSDKAVFNPSILV